MAICFYVPNVKKYLKPQYTGKKIEENVSDFLFTRKFPVVRIVAAAILKHINVTVVENGLMIFILRPMMAIDIVLTVTKLCTLAMRNNTNKCMTCGKEISQPKFSFWGRGNGKTMMELQYNMRQLCCSDECWNKFIEEIRKEIK